MQGSRWEEVKEDRSMQLSEPGSGKIRVEAMAQAQHELIMT